MSSPVLQGPRFEVAMGDSLYPESLLDVERPPEKIYGIGRPEALSDFSVAVIGARKATPYGLSVARLMALRAAQRGLTIVSGGARGCDQEGHKAALETGVPTVVVFGSAPDVTYPKSGRALFQRAIDAGGAVISENPWGTPPLPGYFPQRNRIIAGLANVLIIAEAGLPSGTFSTADAALQAGRTVAAVPGSILSPGSKGSNQLMFQGAIPLVDESVLDTVLDAAFGQVPLSIMESLHQPGAAEMVRPQLDKDPLLRALAADAYSPDELTAYFGFSAAELLRRLSQYEVQGLVERGRDGRYQLCARV